MRGTDIKGLSVISIADGARVGTIDRVLIDPRQQVIAGFDVTEPGSLLSPGPTTFVRTEEIHALGTDAVTIDRSDILRIDGPTLDHSDLFELDDLRKDRVGTESGVAIGSVSDFDFDPTTFAMTELEISQGMFKSNLTIPATMIVSMGRDVVVVQDQVLATLEQATPEPQASQEPQSANEIDSDPMNR